MAVVVRIAQRFYRDFLESDIYPDPTPFVNDSESVVHASDGLQPLSKNDNLVDGKFRLRIMTMNIWGKKQKKKPFMTSCRE